VRTYVDHIVRRDGISIKLGECTHFMVPCAMVEEVVENVGSGLLSAVWRTRLLFEEHAFVLLLAAWWRW
jgi:hypothetical protein